MTDSIPSPTTFDPNADGLPDALSPERLPLGGAGRIVAFVTTTGPDEDQWGPNSVVGVAREWATQGMRVFLADLDFADPKLHRVLELPNEEGVTDAFSFGASVQRVAKRIGELPFFLAPAGTAVHDHEAILTSDRWDLLAEGFSEAGAALLLFVPEDAPGRDHILRRATDLVIVGDKAPEGLAENSQGEARTLAWISPSAGGVDSIPTTVNGLAEAHDEDLGPGTGFQTGAEIDAAGGVEVVEGTDSDRVQSGSDDGEEIEPSEPGELNDGFAEGLPDDLEIAAAEGAEGVGDTLESVGEIQDQGFGEDFGSDLTEISAEGTPFEGLALDIHEEFQEGENQGTEVETGLTGEAPLSEPPSEAQVEELSKGLGQEVAPGYESILEDDQPESPSEAADEVRPLPPTSRGRPKPKPKSRRWLVWGGMAAALVLGGYQLFGGGDSAGGAGGQPADGAVQEPADVVDEAVAPSGGIVPADGTTEPGEAVADPGEPTSPLQEYSVVLRSNSNGVEAQDLADRLSEEVGELLFTVVPAVVNGRTWYRTMAGPARDLEETPGIKERIELAGVLSGADDWFERRTRLAFLLGEFGTIAEADQQALELRDDSVPAYVLAIDYERGPRQFRVYAGGYVSEREGEALGQRLAQAGYPAELVERFGSMPR